MPSTAEKRKQPRTPHRAVFIMPYGQGEDSTFQEAILMDCSPAGVAIGLNRPLTPGDSFLLKLKRDRIVLVAYTVKHCRSVVAGGYHIGAEFAGVVQGTAESPVGPDVIYEALISTGEG
jgi:hypothetical protein